MLESISKMVVQVYGKSTSPQRVMLCLVEKGVEFDIVSVNLEKGEQKHPEYMAKQPFGQVPYIVDGDFGLYESRAIMRYYASKNAKTGTNLLGNTLEEQAKIDQWIDVEAINFNPLVFPIVFNSLILPKQGKPGNQEAVRSSTEKLEKVLEVYEQQLSKTKYLAGDRFTLADLTHIPPAWQVLMNCKMMD